MVLVATLKVICSRIRNRLTLRPKVVIMMKTFLAPSVPKQEALNYQNVFTVVGKQFINHDMRHRTLDCAYVSLFDLIVFVGFQGRILGKLSYKV